MVVSYFHDIFKWVWGMRLLSRYRLIFNVESNNTYENTWPKYKGFQRCVCFTDTSNVMDLWRVLENDFICFFHNLYMKEMFNPSVCLIFYALTRRLICLSLFVRVWVRALGLFVCTDESHRSVIPSVIPDIKRWISWRRWRW